MADDEKKDDPAAPPEPQAEPSPDPEGAPGVDNEDGEVSADTSTPYGEASGRGNTAE